MRTLEERSRLSRKTGHLTKVGSQRVFGHVGYDGLPVEFAVDDHPTVSPYVTSGGVFIAGYLSYAGDSPGIIPAHEEGIQQVQGMSKTQLRLRSEE